MPAARDIKKYHEYWAFLNNIAAQQELTHGEHDRTLTGAFADWLQEHGHPLATLVRHATRGQPYSSDYTVTHPEQLPDDTGLTLGAVNGSSSPNAYRPVEALQDNAHTNAMLLRINRGQNRMPLPVVHTRILIPRTRRPGNDKKAVHVLFHSPLTGDQLREFVYSLPKSRTRADWESAMARTFGLNKPVKPVKLAAIPPASQGATVTVRVPTPQPVASQPKPPRVPQQPDDADQPTQPRGPTFILPG